MTVRRAEATTTTKKNQPSPSSWSRKNTAVPAVAFGASAALLLLSALTISTAFYRTATSSNIRDQELASLSLALLSTRNDNNDRNRHLRTTSTTTTTTSVRAAPSSIPPLDSIVVDGGVSSRGLSSSASRIVGDVQFLLQFAVVGFGKCGTSTMMRWFESHRAEIRIPRQEVWTLARRDDPALFVRQLYAYFVTAEEKSGGATAATTPMSIKRGYKCPAEIRHPHSIEYLRTFWPRTDLIVGIRHPVLWFQSLYNFRVQNTEAPSAEIPHPNALVGPCRDNVDEFTALVCTDMGNFAYYLMQLGKQLKQGRQQGEELRAGVSSRTFFTPLEREIVDNMHFENGGNGDGRKTTAGRIAPEDVVHAPNRLFLYDAAQLEDDDPLRKERFRDDVGRFLGLQRRLPPVPHVKPGMKWDDPRLQAEKDAKKIDICLDEYVPLRRELMKLSRSTSQWIRQVLLSSDDVVTSSTEYLRSNILEQSWMVDPCDYKDDGSSNTMPNSNAAAGRIAS